MENSMNDPKVDIFRDTFVRYLGYSNEVGEAFRAVAPIQFVHLTYGVAFTYAFSDSFHKGFVTWKACREHNKALKLVNNSKPTKIDVSNSSSTIPNTRFTLTQQVSLATFSFVDTIGWQLLASVGIPSLIINRTCWASSKILKQFPNRVTPRVASMTTVGIGLAMIPFIVKPIDHFVHHIMDSHVRSAANVLLENHLHCSKQQLKIAQLPGNVI
mmetsp:Transcript_17561/g.30728  ORF Transcript_17561/g.30728 Transcript_17561/m.30728 type:complete len:214 (-) Transcript_17561:65-706(-)